MIHISKDFENNPKASFGTWVGDAPYFGQCVSYVKKVTPTLADKITRFWKKGAQVKGNYKIEKGTVIATFNEEGRYQGHAAIYVSQTTGWITVVDQWINPNDPSKSQKISKRKITFSNGKIPQNNGDCYYVVETV